MPLLLYVWRSFWEQVEKRFGMSSHVLVVLVPQQVCDLVYVGTQGEWEDWPSIWPVRCSHTWHVYCCPGPNSSHLEANLKAYWVMILRWLDKLQLHDHDHTYWGVVYMHWMKMEGLSTYQTHQESPNVTELLFLICLNSLSRDHIESKTIGRLWHDQACSTWSHWYQNQSRSHYLEAIKENGRV